MLRHIRFANIPPQRWRNGGGETREVAVFHDPALHPDFLWRVSLATVQQAGPFSHFDGVDRSIAVLQGHGMQLSSSNDTAALHRGGEPFCFPGELAITATLADGATTDLNIMTRRNVYRHTLTRIALAQPTTISIEADVTVLLFIDAMAVNAEETDFEVAALDAITGLAPGSLVHFAPTSGTTAYLAQISRL